MRIRTALPMLLGLLTGCASASIAPPKTIRSEKCFGFSKMKVFQILEEGVLAHLCPNDYPSYFDDAFEACRQKGDLVFMPVKATENDYVDDQKVELAENKCFAADGKYSYRTEDGLRKTVRKIRINDSMVPNPAHVAGK